MRIALTIGAAAGALALAASAEAQAHAHLLSATPAVGGVVPPGVRQVTLNFSEEVFAQFSGVVIRNAAGKAAPTGKPVLDPKDHRIMTVPLKAPLPPGAYEVLWHAVSEDTHRKEGSYRFTVR